MKQFTVRLYFIIAILCACFCAVGIRLFTIQILQADTYAQRSKDQAQQKLVIKAKRGKILDRKGRVLALNVESKLTLSPVELENFSSEQVVKKLSGAAAIPIERLYPFGSCASPVLGYIGSDGNGLGGVELAFDRQLRGEDGWAIVQRDAKTKSGKQHKYRTIDLPFKPPRNGNDVTLTLDLDIQKIVQTVLRQTLDTLKARAAMAIILDPSTGEILAMANEPCYDPNVPTRYSLEQRKNDCISEIYEPGSTFKVVTACAALQQGIEKEGDILNGNNGVFEIYDQSIRDHKPFGDLTFTDALAYSSNVCFAKVATKLTNESLYGYARNFGLGASSGITLPGEESGIVHPVREWSGRTRVTMAIGQEISVTFLQMMLVYGAVAHDGVLFRPRIYKTITDTAGAIIDSSVFLPVRRVVDASIAKRLRAMLKRVVEKGTGTRAAIAGVPVAGKTGTSQKLDNRTGAYSDSLYNSSFIGMIPADNPVLLCGVMVDEPAASQSGGIAAAPAFQRIASQVIAHPDLEFAGLILHSNRPVMASGKKNPTLVPSVCGLTKLKAVQLLTDNKIEYTVAGSGDSVIYQIPVQGSELVEKMTVTLYTGSKSYSGISSGSAKVVPDCRGKDLREALAVYLKRGITPFVNGAGIVVSQRPCAGGYVRTAQVCTLFCSFDVTTARHGAKSDSLLTKKNQDEVVGIN